LLTSNFIIGRSEGLIGCLVVKQPRIFVIYVSKPKPSTEPLFNSIVPESCEDWTRSRAKILRKQCICNVNFFRAARLRYRVRSAIILVADDSEAIHLNRVSGLLGSEVQV
jgi:hypothetical protein